MKSLHIISFDIPYPANYGGVIDVFYKLKALHAEGIKIILHCFEYGRLHSTELNKYCEKVFYYKRKMSAQKLLGNKPFIVSSRISEELVKRLLQDDFPILFEGLHTCGILDDKRLKDRLKIYRESNIEHEYYRQLAQHEKSVFKKYYLNKEADKLEKYESILTHANHMLVVSKEDAAYLKNKFPGNSVIYLPSFHENETVSSPEGKGTYALYHGNLSVNENHAAALFLAKEVFSKINYPFIIAGLHPKKELIEYCEGKNNIQIINSPDEKTMNKLICDAHIHCLYTHQQSGLKLKLLNALYKGRFCILNDKMLYGTSLYEACTIANSPEEYLKQLNTLIEKSFDKTEIEKRKKTLDIYNNKTKAEKIKELYSACS